MTVLVCHRYWISSDGDEMRIGKCARSASIPSTGTEYSSLAQRELAYWIAARLAKIEKLPKKSSYHHRIARGYATLIERECVHTSLGRV
jgi:hypothetical protein